MLRLKYRNYYIGYFQITWPISSALFTVLYWASLYGRYNILTSAGILLLVLYLLAYVVESPRFLLSNIPNSEECYEAINKISQINKEGNFTYSLKCENNRKNSLLSIRGIFCSKWVVFRIAICSVLWFGPIFGYYALAFLQPDKEIAALIGFDDH